jgi:hypothetical protein
MFQRANAHVYLVFAYLSFCNLCPLKQSDNCLYLFSSCTNKHIDNFCTNRPKKAVYAINILLAHPTIRCFTLINAGKLNERTPENTILSWLLPCCKCPTRLRSDILCTLGATPTSKPWFSPNPNLKVQLFEFTYCNDRFSLEATTRKPNKYVVLLPLLTQQVRQVLPPIIIIDRILDTIHTTTTKSLTNPRNAYPKKSQTHGHVLTNLHHISNAH